MVRANNWQDQASSASLRRNGARFGFWGHATPQWAANIVAFSQVQATLARVSNCSSALKHTRYKRGIAGGPSLCGMLKFSSRPGTLGVFVKASPLTLVPQGYNAGRPASEDLAADDETRTPLFLHPHIGLLHPCHLEVGTADDRDRDSGNLLLNYPCEPRDHLHALRIVQRPFANNEKPLHKSRSIPPPARKVIPRTVLHPRRTTQNEIPRLEVAPRTIRRVLVRPRR